jgi:adenine/guanine/hypoxanthine permease
VGIGAYFVYGVVLGKGLSWQAAFCAGVLMFVLSLSGLRNFMFRVVPQLSKSRLWWGWGCLK